MRKYGPDEFKVETLCIVPHESIDNMEAYWAEQLETYMWDTPGGYNMVWCGTGCRRGIPHTAATKYLQSCLAKERGAVVGPKVSAALTGRKMTDAQREHHILAMSNPDLRRRIGDRHRGKTISDEQREMLRVASQKFWTPEQRAKKAEEMRGRIVSSETISKLSESKKGHAVSTETREKLRQANLGKKVSDEVKEKQSAMRLGKKRGPMTDEAKMNMSLAKKGRPASEKMKAARQSESDARFRAIFNKRLPLWIADPVANKQWRYDMTRKKRDGRLLREFIDILEASPGWSWS